MRVVVPTEEGAAMGLGVFQGTETLGEAGAVFQGLELSLGEGVVIAHMGAAIGFGHAEVCQQQATALEVMLEPRL